MKKVKVYFDLDYDLDGSITILEHGETVIGQISSISINNVEIENSSSTINQN